jgi:carbon monoxide dehydrogenase subunit G
MQMSGERVIAAERARVWAALNDADVLKACIPGCTEMVKTSPTAFEAKVTQKVGPVRANFTGEVELSDIVEGESYKISGKGKGGAAGGATGGAAVRLEEVPEGTKLAYDVEAKVTGKLAQLGSRLIDGFAKQMADAFFDRFKAEVEGPEAGAEQGDEQQQSGSDSATDNASDGGTAEAEAAAREALAREGRAGTASTDGQRPDEMLAGNVAGERARQSAGSAVESGLRREGVEPGAPKKSWWARLFG